MFLVVRPIPKLFIDAAVSVGEMCQAFCVIRVGAVYGSPVISGVVPVPLAARVAPASPIVVPSFGAFVIGGYSTVISFRQRHLIGQLFCFVGGVDQALRGVIS